MSVFPEAGVMGEGGANVVEEVEEGETTEADASAVADVAEELGDREREAEAGALVDVGLVASVAVESERTSAL